MASKKLFDNLFNSGWKASLSGIILFGITVYLLISERVDVVDSLFFFGGVCFLLFSPDTLFSKLFSIKTRGRGKCK